RPEAAANDEHVYGAAVAGMILAADDILGTPIDELDLRDLPLRDVLARLAAAAGVEAISFPYGPDVQPDTAVRLDVEQGTLADALAELCERLDLPELTWVRCRGMGQRGDVLFAHGERSTVPIQAGRTGLVSQSEAELDPILAAAGTEGQENLALLDVAYTGDHFRFSEATAVVVTMPQPRMQVAAAGGGEVLWRIVEARPSEVPEALTDEIRQLVIEDLLAEAAMAAALEAAAEFAEQAQNRPLGELAESRGYEVLTTGLVTRRSSDIPGLDFQYPMMREDLLTAAILLARKQSTLVGADELDLALEDDTDDIDVVALPADGMVCVFRVLDHVLPTDEERATGYARAVQSIQIMQQQVTLFQWFAWDEILKRTGFEPKRTEDETPES
ncbi:MAG: hypothetical protein ACYTFO_00695, partial [Planctomycetota bacterium]